MLSALTDFEPSVSGAAKIFAERRKHIEGMRRYIVDPADQTALIVNKGNGKTSMDALTSQGVSHGQH